MISFASFRLVLVLLLIARATLYGQSAEQWFQRGDSLELAGNSAAAITAYTKALTIQPRFVSALANRAISKQSVGDLQGARADYDAAIAIDPSMALLYANRGTVLAEMQQSKAALADFDEALRRNPHDADTWANKGLIYYRDGDYTGSSRAAAIILVLLTASTIQRRCVRQSWGTA
jgi:tetratricopeptide (TPR) repeat protein